MIKNDFKLKLLIFFRPLSVHIDPRTNPCPHFLIRMREFGYFDHAYCNSTGFISIISREFGPLKCGLRLKYTYYS